jgi:Flp pilus assembly protein TadD
LAIKDYAEVIRLRPNDPGAYNNRGGTYEKIGEKELAIKDFKKAYELGSRWPYMVRRLKESGQVRR